MTWPPPSPGRVRHHLGRALAASWVSLALLLPAVLGWVWADRVDGLVF